MQTRVEAFVDEMSKIAKAKKRKREDNGPNMNFFERHPKKILGTAAAGIIGGVALHRKLKGKGPHILSPRQHEVLKRVRMKVERAVRPSGRKALPTPAQATKNDFIFPGLGGGPHWKIDPTPARRSGKEIRVLRRKAREASSAANTKALPAKGHTHGSKFPLPVVKLRDGKKTEVVIPLAKDKIERLGQMVEAQMTGARLIPTPGTYLHSDKAAVRAGKALAGKD